MKQLETYLAQNPKSHLIFDFDETIAELLLPWDVWYAKLEQIIMRYESDDLRSYTDGTSTLHEAMNTFVSRFGAPAKQAIVDMSRDFEKNNLQGLRRNEALIAFIKKQSDTYRMSVWTSNTGDVVAQALRELAIQDAFDVVATMDAVTYIKPDIEGFSLIHDDITPMSQMLFIGDSASDEKTAATLGIDFFKVTF